MPLFIDRFAGHYFPGDPRTPVSVAGGCTWPTVPAYRYFLHSPNATGVLLEMRTIGCLFTRTNNYPDHDDGSWILTAKPIVVANGLIRKVWLPAEQHAVWVVNLELTSGLGNLIWIWVNGYQKCNVDKKLWSRCVEDGCEFGETGSETILQQVVWDELSPPGW